MLQQPSFNVVTVFQSPACTTNINAPCDSLSSFLFLTIARRGCPGCCCHGNRGAGPPLGDLETTWSKDPYVIGALLLGVCACVCSGVTVFIVVCSKPSDIFCRVIKQVSHGGIGAVESHTPTTAQEDKYNLEATMKAKGTLIFNVRPVNDLTTRKYNRGTTE